jgi:hypothetical protein
MVLILFRVQNVAKRLDPRRINAMRFVHKIKPDSSGSSPAMVSGVAILSFQNREKAKRYAANRFRSTYGNIPPFSK